MTTTYDGDDSVAPDDIQHLGPLRVVANSCSAGSCPTIYSSDTGALIVQGLAVRVEDVGVNVPSGEALVEIPLGLLTEAFRNLS